MDKVLIFKTLAFIICYKIVDAGIVNNEQKEDHVINGKCKSICSSTECEEEAKSLLEIMDQSINPCDNFYDFACGNYLKQHVIPEDKVTVSLSSEVQDQLDEKLIDTIKAEVLPTDLEAFKKLKMYYKNCFDEAEIEKIGVTPLVNMITRMGGWPVLLSDKWNENGYDWEEVLSRISGEGLSTSFPIDLLVDLDSINSQNHSLKISSTDTEINDAADDEFIEAYKSYLVEIAVLLGADRERAKIEMTNVVEFDQQLFKAQIPRDQLDDVSPLENRKRISDLNKEHPEFPWLDVINSILVPSNVTIDENEFVQVYDPKFISEVGSLMKNTPRRVLANYQIYKVIDGLIDFLPAEFRNVKLMFLHKKNGQKKWPTREKFCLKKVKRHFRIAIGSLYLRNYFNRETKTKVNEIIQNIREETKASLKELDWMDDYTLEGALKKIENMKTLAAYPDELFDDEKVESVYKNLEITPGKLFDDVQKISSHTKNFKFNKLRKPASEVDWITSANVATVNAFYFAEKNQINIVAGILQKPFFESQRPNYLNYGSIGDVIGHEITHGFDYSGRKFDYEGNFKNWWNDKTVADFEKKVQCNIDHYNNYSLEQIDKKINGKLTIGENIADAGGIKLAYRAYEKLIKNKGAAEDCLPNLSYTPKQLFWISSAITWCEKSTDQYIKRMIAEDPHSPSEARVNVVYSDNKDFAIDFECPVGSKMNPITKCEVW